MNARTSFSAGYDAALDRQLKNLIAMTELKEAQLASLRCWQLLRQAEMLGHLRCIEHQVKAIIAARTDLIALKGEDIDALSETNAPDDFSNVVSLW